jgi:zinc protease
LATAATLKKSVIEKLREFYDTYYWPNNATVTIIGDFQPQQALEMIQKTFGVYPKVTQADSDAVHRGAAKGWRRAG